MWLLAGAVEVLDVAVILVGHVGNCGAALLEGLPPSSVGNVVSSCESLSSICIEFVL